MVVAVFLGIYTFIIVEEKAHGHSKYLIMILSFVKEIFHLLLGNNLEKIADMNHL
jgi:hypothetical protein